MFLYAKVVLSSIEDLEVDEIKKDLSVLPETLNDAYARILERIEKQTSAATRDKARKLIGWISVSPTPLTINELEQALVVSVQGVDESGRVTSRLSIVHLCGPIVEDINGYVEFVHFTVKEFFLSSSIPGSIDLYEAHLSLAACCIKYLCQNHHNPELSSDRISEYILSGAYRLHDFAATMWLKLTVDCVSLENSGTLSETLAQLLSIMITRRTNALYNKDYKSSEGSTGVKSFGTQNVELQILLCQANLFRANTSISSYDLRGSNYWTDLDPLTTSQTSHQIHKQFDKLIFDAGNHHALNRHYGERLFKCGFFECPFRRHGFESRNIRSAHTKHHSQPWKCSFPDCEFQEGGFLSRKMRDEHLDQAHRKIHVLTLDPSQVLAEKEIEAILPDLVKRDDVVSTVKLLASIDIQRSYFDELLALGARYASPDMLAMLVSSYERITTRGIKYHTTLHRDMLSECIDGDNVKVFRYLIMKSKELDGIKRVCVGEALKKVNDEMIEILDVWIKGMLGRNEAVSFLTNCSSISGTGADIYKEQILLNFWRYIPEPLWRKKPWENALPNVASTTCSLKLATYLIERGVPVDTRISMKYPTALAYAAKKNTLAAAELMRYLLHCGAEPTIERVAIEISGREAESHTVRIGEEKGAKRLSEWLGVSWDELVAQAKEKREIL